MTKHRTVPTWVWADIDEGVVEMVERLNALEGVRTFASCQGTIGEGGAAPYGPYVLIGWDGADARARIAALYDVDEDAVHRDQRAAGIPSSPTVSWGYAYPRATVPASAVRPGEGRPWATVPSQPKTHETPG